MKFLDWLGFLGLFFVIPAARGHVHSAVETEMFSIPISPNLFNWTYQEFDQQYRFHASLVGKPELPTWLHYIYSRRHHSGFIFGTPPRGTKQPITLEIIGLNRQDYETRRVLITLSILSKESMARHEVALKIDNLNVEDLLDEHRMTRLKDILRAKLWTESSHDLYATFLASAIDMGARLPLKPEDGEGLVVRLGSSVPFSTELQRLREEVRPLKRLKSCPREYKRTTVERLFRDAAFTLDWCSFELYNTIYKPRSTQLVEYLSPDPLSEGPTPPHKPTSPHSPSNLPKYERELWTAPSRQSLPHRSLTKTLLAAMAVPVLLLLLCIAALTAIVCFHYAAIRDPDSDNFFNNIFHICIEYKNRRAHKSSRVELCRYTTEQDTDQTNADNTSTKSIGVSPNNSLARPYSPKSSSNLAGSYNRPQPPPYMGSNTNSLHHRKSTIEKSPSAGHTPDHRLALEESLKLLNEANISNPSLKLDTDFDIPLLKEPIVDITDGSEDYVPIKPDSAGYISMKADLDDIEVPELAKFGIGGAI